MKRIIENSIVITAVIMSFSQSPSVRCQGIEYVSSTLHHNPYYSVGKAGNYVYNGGPFGLHIFDISDPSNPNLVRIYDYGKIDIVFIDGGFAYLMANHPRYIWTPLLRVLDISDPLNPIVVGTLEHLYGDYANFSQYRNNTIYTSINTFDSLGSGFSKLIVIDVSNPANPVYSDTLDLPHLISGLWISDDYLQTTSHEFDYWEYFWSIYSLDNPARPSHLLTMEFGTEMVDGVSACENYAYLNFYDGIHIYDFSYPRNPFLVRIDDSGLLAGMLAVNGDTGFAMYSNSIITLDLTDPVYPIQMGSLYVPGGLRSFYYGTDTCIATTTSKFTIIDFTDLYEPIALGTHVNPAVSLDAQLSGDYAYIANADSGITIVDISDPALPLVLDSFGPGAAKDILIKGNIACILAGSGYLGIYDISDPMQPELLGHWSDNSGETRAMSVDNNFIYITKIPYNSPHASFVSILDISDLSSPTPVASIDNLYFPDHLIVKDDYVYIDCYEDLKIYDVSNLDSIAFVSSYEPRNDVRQIAVELPYLYMASWSKGIEIADVSDPANPYFVSEYDSLFAFDITLTDNFAVLKGSNGLYLMDISDPQEPVLISSYTFDYGGSCEEVFVRGEYIYDPAFQQFQILKFTPTGIEEIGSVELPQEFTLLQNFPNPFNPSTTIRYALPEQTDVRIEIYNILGQRVTTLFDGIKPAGYHSVTWQADDYPSGVYFARLETGTRSESIKMVLLK